MGGVELAIGAAKTEAVFQREKSIAAGFLVFDGETNEILWRPAVLPIHGNERHAIAAMKFECEECRCALTTDLKFICHSNPLKQ
ncbi:hypothetical protein [Nitrosomonas oligotropha]|uniref:hypothetical protein n=1 Tax=Nitrosomonas oligotropha TaxID=42354 RepID=UPI001C40B76F|nr:hypothetical protein [Nitrosomonas oligotropha]